MADGAPEHPLRDGFVAGLGCTLVVGLVLALVDVAAAAAGPGGLGVLPSVLGLWSVPTLGFGLYAGAVAAGAMATFGPSPWRRLRERPELDVTLSATLLAAALLALALHVGLGPVLGKLVVKANRKLAGAQVAKVAAVVLVIGLALAVIPLQRALRRVAGWVPTVGPLPRLAVVAIAVGVGLLLYARHFLLHAGFDAEALPVGELYHLAALPILTVVVAALAYGPLAPVRRRMPAPTALVAGGTAVAVILAGLVVTRQPSPDVVRSVSDQGLASRLMVTVFQGMIDRDGDGYSAFFGGPDCDDHDARVHPNAVDVPGNGIDENCQYGDAPVDDTAGPAGGADAGPAPAADAGVATGPRLNLIIVMIDTLRVDRLGASGYRRDGESITPNLDRFLAQAVWFRRAYAQANNTPRSMPSFMTSRYPSQVKVDKSYAKYPRLDDANDMLFERLQAAGWHTVGVASHHYFRAERNFTQGFDEFDNDGALDIGPSNKDVASPRIVPEVEARLAALAGADRPFAMFVHLFEPHSSWIEHEGDPRPTARGTAAHSHRYDYEVKFVDRWVEKIFEALDSNGLADRTVVVVMSDHGESFGDHSFAGESMFHGTNLYEEQIRVPFAFRVPGATARQVDSVVQLIDLAPTVCDLLGAAPGADWMGRSLAPAIRGDALPPRPAFAELLRYPGWDHDLKAAISGDGAWKLIDVMSQRRKELYDLAADPAEKRDLWGQAAAADHQQEMLGLMARFVDGILAR